MGGSSGQHTPSVQMIGVGGIGCVCDDDVMLSMYTGFYKTVLIMKNNNIQ